VAPAAQQQRSKGDEPTKKGLLPRKRRLSGASGFERKDSTVGQDPCATHNTRTQEHTADVGNTLARLPCTGGLWVRGCCARAAVATEASESAALSPLSPPANTSGWRGARVVMGRSLHPAACMPYALSPVCLGAARAESILLVLRSLLLCCPLRPTAIARAPLAAWHWHRVRL
jgi:hypothetical protein